MVLEHVAIAGVMRMLVEDAVPVVAVVDECSALCGVITPLDLLAAGEDWTAVDAMSSVPSVSANASIEDVADLMARVHAAHVVVIADDGQVVGIVSARDVARHRAGY